MMTETIKRRVKKTILFAMVGLLISSYGSLFFLGNNAGAVSAYDNLYQTTDKLMLTSNNIEDLDFDVTNKIYAMMNGYYDKVVDNVRYMEIDGYGDMPVHFYDGRLMLDDEIVDLRDDFNNALNSEFGNWYISQFDYGNRKDVELCFSENNMQILWDEDFGLTADGPGKQCIWFYVEIMGGVGNSIIIRKDYTGGGSTISGGYGNAVNYVANISNQNYPEGYQGEPIKDTVIELKDLQPEVFVSVDDRKIKGLLCLFGPEITETNKQEICKQSKLPWGNDTNIKWQLKNDPGDENAIAESTGKVHEVPSFETEVDIYATYWLIVEYIYPGLPFESAESAGYRLHVLNLPLVVDGSKYITGSGKDKNDCTNGFCQNLPPQFVRPECLIKQMPYVNAEGCIKNMLLFLDDMTFNAMKIKQRMNALSLEDTRTCGNIPTIGSWLNLQNKTVCSQIPAYVRDTVTPFIIVALALAMIMGVRRYYVNG